MKVQEDGVQVYGDKSMKSKEELGVNIEDRQGSNGRRSRNHPKPRFS